MTSSAFYTHCTRVLRGERAHMCMCAVYSKCVCENGSGECLRGGPRLQNQPMTSLPLLNSSTVSHTCLSQQETSKKKKVTTGHPYFPFLCSDQCRFAKHTCAASPSSLHLSWWQKAGNGRDRVLTTGRQSELCEPWRDPQRPPLLPLQLTAPQRCREWSSKQGPLSSCTTSQN